MRLAFLVTTLSFVIANTAFSSTIYVDGNATGIVNDGANWCDAYLTLQDALAAAEESAGTIDEIRVADGVYKPDQGSGQTPGDRAATFQLQNGVTIAGGYAGCGAAKPNARDIAGNETILSGDLTGNDIVVPVDELSIEPTRSENSCQVIVSSFIDATAVLDGVTITGGNAKFGCTFINGGGIHNNGGSPTISNCTFIQNNSAIYGGGMYNKDGNPLITNCTFNQNSSSCSGGIYNRRSSPTITSCTFMCNSATDGDGEFPCGGVYNDHGSCATITNCIFIRNTGLFSGGMVNTGPAHIKPLVP